MSWGIDRLEGVQEIFEGAAVVVHVRRIAVVADDRNLGAEAMRRLPLAARVQHGRLPGKNDRHQAMSVDASIWSSGEGKHRRSNEAVTSVPGVGVPIVSWS